MMHLFAGFAFADLAHTIELRTTMCRLSQLINAIATTLDIEWVVHEHKSN